MEGQRRISLHTFTANETFVLKSGFLHLKTCFSIMEKQMFYKKKLETVKLLSCPLFLRHMKNEKTPKSVMFVLHACRLRFAPVSKLQMWPIKKKNWDCGAEEIPLALSASRNFRRCCSKSFIPLWSSLQRLWAVAFASMAILTSPMEHRASQ